jgi:hypothetical protein
MAPTRQQYTPRQARSQGQKSARLFALAAGQTQSRLADHIAVMARSAATKQSQSDALEIASLRSQ